MSQLSRLRRYLAERRFRRLPRRPAWRAPGPEIQVRCFDNWLGFEDALAALTPGGLGIWDGVGFSRSPATRPDWIGVFNQAGEREVEILASPNRVFFASGEPPLEILRPYNEGQGRGTVVFTSDMAAAAANAGIRRFVTGQAILGSWSVRRSYDQLRASSVGDKPRRLSWVTSNLAVLAGHRYRLAFLRRLQAAVDFDLYGRGFRPIDDKWDALAPYRYSIAFENCVAPLYFSEKLMDCFVAETMPLYFGSPAIAAYFPAEAMVIIDPEDPGVFDRIRATIASDLYLKNREAIREAKRRVLEEYNCFAYLARFIRAERSPAAPPERLLLRPAKIDYSQGG